MRKHARPRARIGDDKDENIRTMLHSWFPGHRWLADLQEVRDLFHGLMDVHGEEYRRGRRATKGFPELDELSVYRELRRVKNDLSVARIGAQAWVLKDLWARADRAVRRVTRRLPAAMTEADRRTIRVRAAQFMHLAHNAREEG